MIASLCPNHYLCPVKKLLVLLAHYFATDEVCDARDDEFCFVADYQIKIIMAIVDLIMPKLGESITEATILKWHKQPGDPVKMDETVLDIATDKVDSEVPSTAEGVIESLLFNVNDVVPIGTVIARINTQGNNQQSAMSNEQTESSKPATKTEGENYSQAQNNLQQSSASAEATNYKPQTTNSSNRFYSPLVLNIAAQEGISMVELENIPGTGAEGRVSKRDILQYVSDKRAGRTAASSGPQATSCKQKQHFNCGAF